MAELRHWVIRAGRGAEHIDLFREKSLVAMSFPSQGKVSTDISQDALRQLFERAARGEKTGAIQTWTAQAYRFIKEISKGDVVVTYDPNQRVYLLGKVTSGYQWLSKEMPDAPHVRRVEWTHNVLRDALSVETRNTLGAIQTLFQVNPQAAEDLHQHATALSSPDQVPSASVPEPETKKSPEDEALRLVRDETIGRSDGFIEDRIARLGWDEMQELVAGILRAMRYKTMVSPPGADRGFDVFASPDGLGLEEPRIFVEVKHRSGAMGSKEIRAFLGGRKPGDKCLYVSTGGFTKDARYEAERSTVPLRLITLADLRQLLIDWYEQIDSETRALVPLKRLYWPAD